jgi:DNA-binding winged helix-turn-helix (wHTH) protein/pimeloyl-ACP methyl ester carboxylesterase
MSNSGKEIYRFDQFQVDASKRLLFENGEIVSLTPKAFDTLLALVESQGNVVSKEELMQIVWPNQFLEENNLAQNIHAIRRALGEGIGNARYVETIPKRGYRFVAQIEVSTKTERQLDVGAYEVSFKSVPDGPQARESLAVQRAVVAAPLNPKTQYVVSTGDVNIAYQVVGDHPIDLVFVMGWVSHLEYFWREPSFARFLTRLASFSRLILLDKRGTGLSDRVELSQLPTLEQRMTDVEAVMNAVGSERAALLGISEGGPMCSLFAATYPARTEALVMIGTYAKRIKSDDYPWAPTESDREHFLEEIRREWGEPVGLEERAPSVAKDPSFRKWWAEYLRMGASPTAALALTKMNAQIDVRAVLPSVRVPALIIHRENDACLPVEGGRYVASKIPGAKYVELPGFDHLPFVGDQDAILEEIEEFLTGERVLPEIDRVLTTVLFVISEEPSGESVVDDSELRTLNLTYSRRELSVYRGKEIEIAPNKLFATFDGPARAIRCARAIVGDAMRLGLPVRAGLHTGECDLLANTVGGMTVDIGRDIAAAAREGEILVSHTVKDLVAGSGIGFKFRATHKFGDLFSVDGAER